MSNPEKQSNGVLVSLMRACPACDMPVRASAERCPGCDLDRPGSGWVPVEGGVTLPPPDELEDDPDTATSAPPPVVPVDAVPASRPPVAPRASEPPTLMGVYVRFFGTFLVSTALTALLIVLIGYSFLPERPVARFEATPVAPSPIVLPPVPVAPEVVVQDPITTTDADTDAVPTVAEPAAPAPAPVTQPRAVRPAPVEPEPEPEVVVPEPVPAPVPEPVAPAAARALNGTYIGRADGDPISMELTFQREQQLSAVLRVAGRDGTEVHRVTGTYTLAPDGSADFALTDRTDDGITGYSGSVSGSEARGVVTVDGRRRGRFNVGR